MNNKKKKVIKKSLNKKYKKPINSYLDKFELGGDVASMGLNVASDALMKLVAGSVGELIGTLKGNTNEPELFKYTENTNRPIMKYGGMMDYMAMGGMVGNPTDPKKNLDTTKEGSSTETFANGGTVKPRFGINPMFRFKPVGQEQLDPEQALLSGRNNSYAGMLGNLGTNFNMFGNGLTGNLNFTSPLFMQSAENPGYDAMFQPTMDANLTARPVRGLALNAGLNADLTKPVGENEAIRKFAFENPQGKFGARYNAGGLNVGANVNTNFKDENRGQFNVGYEDDIVSANINTNTGFKKDNTTSEYDLNYNIADNASLRGNLNTNYMGNTQSSIGATYNPFRKLSLSGDIGLGSDDTRAGNFAADYEPVKGLKLGSKFDTDFANTNLGEFSARYTNPAFEIGSKVNTDFKDKGTTGRFDARISPTKGLNITGDVDTDFTKQGTSGNVGVDYRNKLFNARYNLGINPTEETGRDYNFMNTFNVGFTPTQGTNIFAKGSFENDFKNPTFETGLTQDLNTTNKNKLPVKFAKGGMVEMPNAEVEGGEIYELPDGEIGQFEGPDHSEGGIKINAPAGTEIKSKQIKDKNGKSIADKEKAMAKEEKRLEDAIANKGSKDAILEKTLNRVKQKNELKRAAHEQIQEYTKQKEAADKAVEGMQQATEFVNKYGGTIPKYAQGGLIDLLGTVGMEALGGLATGMMGMGMSGGFDKKKTSSDMNVVNTDTTDTNTEGTKTNTGVEIVPELQQIYKDLYGMEFANGGTIPMPLAARMLPNYIFNMPGSAQAIQDVYGFNDPNQYSTTPIKTLTPEPLANPNQFSIDLRNYDSKPTISNITSSDPVYSGPYSTTPIKTIDAAKQLGLKVPDNFSGLELSNNLNNLTSDAVVSSTTQGMPSTIPGIKDLKTIKPNLLETEPINLPKAEGLSEEDIPKLESSTTGQEGSPFTLGDLLGLTGTGIGGVMPGLMTIANRMGDSPNINPYLGYGQQGLAQREAMKGAYGQLRDQLVNESKLVNRTGRRSARANTRSINTLRGLEQLQNAQLQNQIAKINTNYGAQIGAINKEIAAAMDVRDKMEMTGRAQKDLADRQDRDNFYTQLNKDFGNLGTALQKVGGDLNVKRGDEEFMNLLQYLNNHGFTFKRDKNGNLEMVSTNTNKKVKTKDANKIIDIVDKETEEADNVINSYQKVSQGIQAAGKEAASGNLTPEYADFLLGQGDLNIPLMGNTGNIKNAGNIETVEQNNQTQTPVTTTQQTNTTNATTNATQATTAPTTYSSGVSNTTLNISNKKPVNPVLETNKNDGNDYIRKRLNFENIAGSFDGNGVSDYGFTGGGGSAKGTAMKAYFDAEKGTKEEKAVNSVNKYIIGTNPKTKLKGGNTSILTDLNYTREQFDKLPEHIKEELVDWKLNTGRGTTDLLLNALDPELWSGRDAAEKSSPNWGFVENHFAKGTGDEIKKYEDLTKEDLRKARMRLYQGRIEYLKEKYGEKDKRYLAAKKGFENSQQYR